MTCVLVAIFHDIGIDFLLFQDTAGSERYESMSRIYYRGAKSAIVCFGQYIVVFVMFNFGCIICFVFVDLTDPSSFERAKFWVNELKQTEEVHE